MSDTIISGLKHEASRILSGLGLHNVTFDEAEEHGGGMLGIFLGQYPIQRITDWTVRAGSAEAHAETHEGLFVLDSRNPPSKPEVYSHSYCGTTHCMAIQGVAETTKGVRQVAGSLWIGTGRSAPREILMAFDQMSRQARAELLLDDAVSAAKRLLANGGDAVPVAEQERIDVLRELADALERARSDRQTVAAAA